MEPPTQADQRASGVVDIPEVERVFEGCDAVLHAASVSSSDARRADEMALVNVRGTELVLGTAHRLGLNPIVYVSSEVALLPPADRELLPGLVARKLQALDAPVVSVMPAALWGPQDPHLGEGVTMATNVLRNRYPVVMPGGTHIADVRDVAAVLAAVMQPAQGLAATWWPGIT